MYYYRVKVGYGSDEFLSVSENELSKALILFLEGSGRGLFEEGAIRGQDIIRILPDFHRARGWNKSWRMTDEDYADVKHIENSHWETYRLAENVAKEIIKQNRQGVLSENKPLKELSEMVLKGLLPKKVGRLETITEEIKKIATKKKI